MELNLSSLQIAIPLIVLAVLLSLFDEGLLALVCCFFALWVMAVDTEIKISANREYISLAIHSSKTKGGV